MNAFLIELSSTMLMYPNESFKQEIKPVVTKKYEFLQQEEKTFKCKLWIPWAIKILIQRPSEKAFQPNLYLRKLKFGLFLFRKISSLY